MQEHFFSDDDWETLMQISNPHPEATVSFYNLKPNKEYQFRIIAVNGHGISEPSPESAFLTTLGMRLKYLFIRINIAAFFFLEICQRGCEINGFLFYI